MGIAFNSGRPVGVSRLPCISFLWGGLPHPTASRFQVGLRHESASPRFLSASSLRVMVCNCLYLIGFLTTFIKHTDYLLCYVVPNCLNVFQINLGLHSEMCWICLDHFSVLSHIGVSIDGFRGRGGSGILRRYYNGSRSQRFKNVIVQKYQDSTIHHP